MKIKLTASSAVDSLKKLAQPEKIHIYQNFFKTGKGQYGEGDIFIGVTVPNTRNVANKFIDLKSTEIKKLLDSKIHEVRLLGFILIVLQFKKSKDDSIRKKLFDFYLKNKKQANNWDLVDLSAYFVIGAWLKDKDKKILFQLAKSKSIWDRRIAIISTLAFIRENDFKTTIKLSEILLKDNEDLMHKAVGWMLREVGKRDINILIKFLNQHSIKMPRTMLRYSIEKFPEKIRKHYLQR